jgi:DNA-binding NtrC family response regulator
MATILVAEDDAHVMRLMSMWLARNGHNVLEATNGLQAKELVSAGGVDFLVTDINMPHCNGIELAQWLREEFKSEIPVVMLSARCDQAQIGEQLHRLKVSVHPKPFSPSRLSNEIERLLEEARSVLNAGKAG